MVPAWLLADVAQPSLPPLLGWTSDAQLLGGVDTWDGEPGAVGELALGAAGQASFGPGAWSLAYAGDVLRTSFDANFYDVHAVEAGATAFGFAGPGGVLGLRGAALTPTPWGEAAAAGRWRFAGRTSADLRAGVALRGSDGESAAGALATVLADADLTPRLLVAAAVDTRLWFPGAPITGEADAVARLTWATGPWLSVGALGGFSGVLPGDGAAWGGVAAPGSVIGSGSLFAEVRVVRHLALVAEAGAERALGADEWTRFGARLGVRSRWREVRRLGPPVPPGPVRFGWGAGPSQVEVLGSFNDWQAVPLVPGATGEWELAVPLPPGVYEYVYRVDGVTVVPPEAAQTRPDGFGGANGVLIVDG